MEINDGMTYNTYITDILHSLGIHKMYKGCDYILSGIRYISKNETSYSPITKILYVEIAKEYGTSHLCVEKNIRSVIELIWKQKENESLIRDIFGSYYLLKRPSNMEFLTLLYDYVKCTLDQASAPKKDECKFICPLSGNECHYCTDFILKYIENSHKE